jgi:hypothetical protein
MGLNFDIMSAPPDTATIAAAHAEHAAERQRLRELNKKFLIVIVTIVSAIVCFLLLVAVPLVSRPEMEGSFVFLIVYALPYFFFSVFVVGNTMHHHKVDVPKKALRLAEAALQQGEQDDIAELLEACQTHAPLGAYQSQVATQGRALFRGELEAMRSWLEGQSGK